jgi:hypothetical protein
MRIRQAVVPIDRSHLNYDIGIDFRDDLDDDSAADPDMVDVMSAKASFRKKDFCGAVVGIAQ